MADKLLKRAESLPSIKPPDDKTITTLWVSFSFKTKISNLFQVGGVTSEIKEDDLQQYFYQFGEIATINIVEKNCCAFVQFTKRESAEHAATKCYGRLDMKVGFFLLEFFTKDEFLGQKVKCSMGTATAELLQS